ncbi:tRNA uridine-5-carboxymethylaminomethyl(34) synthesis GTPase MnmE [Dethiobacter alkaliphilus]|uniref:tRNA uridine-5-carboxymethylaminomethyl(34) synthesis GTPase MnmE n=1 Tax=Dethiobacter alkaliphilus TaxID=427926 RepID=UPI002227CD31|nr:tRNA uridine-5-carboxymethylaminomethyl(34) synthesis GTPase MnmE [Dethiobacter alkaliphilus]MCW3488971.1 tRNA uridine-5-carboxymethylaminomethyl(34) synthesis GTPase MnmE [Dethiobacter alkaliphilus]
MHEDTIAAIATPVGEGGIGIVRISGPQAKDIGKELFRFHRPVQNPQSHKLYYGHVIGEGGEVLDEALLAFMNSPRTYTTEDVVEINCHGGIMPLKKTLERTLQLGARLAEPGEFTQRAFLNGRIDLAQAEAVIQIIRARTETAMHLSVAQLQGRLSHKVGEIRQQLLSVLAHMEASIDFPEHQDVEDVAFVQLREAAKLAHKEIDSLLQTADKGRILREGLRTAIVGRPNVGKSSLLNALLKEQRAIVTDIPGTTRDVLEESVNLGGIALTMVDTAGIRETTDTVEKMGVERSREALGQADLVLYVLDASDDLTAEDMELLQVAGEKPLIVIVNKTDLVSSPADVTTKLHSELASVPVVPMSVVENKGLQELEEAIVSLVFQGDVKPSQSAMVTSARHKDALSRSLTFLQDMLSALASGFAIDLLAIDLHSALDALGEITGETVGADLADEIFSAFCIGK